MTTHINETTIEALEKVKLALTASVHHAAGIGNEAYNAKLQRQCNEALALLPSIIEAVRNKYDPHLDGCPLYTGEEAEGMMEAFNRAKEHRGDTETLFAVATYILRARGHLPKPPAAGSEA